MKSFASAWGHATVMMIGACLATVSWEVWKMNHPFHACWLVLTGVLLNAIAMWRANRSPKG